MLDVPQLLSRLKISLPRSSAAACAMCSMGGVGSTALARHVGSISDKTIREHAYTPNVYEGDKGIRLGYMYGNPYDAVLSVFRRNFQDMHSKAMNINSPTPYKSLKGVSIEQYAEEAVDYFNIQRQFDNWTNPDLVKHPTILIKYEGLVDSIDDILGFFESTEPFEVRGRNSAWMKESPKVIDGLQTMYGDLAKQIEAMPAVKILLPKQWQGLVDID
ncbi:MAG: hypothetical protein VB958_02815 [Thalassolituus sp.]|uniref:hypothetical protein n=1 Tax=Thalassolituus sp. TaxID=2030822 RepID=UPI0039828E34